mgnify:CR=1 FL=1
MPRYLNDDAIILPNIRTAIRITTDELKQKMIEAYDILPSVIACNASFVTNNYLNDTHALNDLISVLSYEHKQIAQDKSNIRFDIENLDTSSPPVFGYAGDVGTDLCGLRTLPNGLTICGAIAGGDWEDPLFYCIYFDGTNLRAYIPIKGNTVNCDTFSAFGSEVNLNNPNIPHNLIQLYDAYQKNGFLTPANISLDDFIDGNNDFPKQSYLAQYNDLKLVGKQYSLGYNAFLGGFNWDAISDELMTAIEIR